MTRYRMPLLRLCEQLLGRRNMVRTARLALDYARRDLPNRMASNGEWMVQDTVVHCRAEGPLTILDVGANVGAWSRRLLEVCEAGNIQNVVVYAFEPSLITFRELTEGLSDRFADRFVAVPMAVSNISGSATLYSVHDLAGSNSLHGFAGTTEGLQPEAVELCTVDGFCHSASIDRVNLLKVDAEGHDMLVLLGASEMLRAGAIDIVQFEYNFRWIGARTYLKDVFDLVTPMGHYVGKVTPESIEWYSRWDPELETFREANYLVAKESEVVGFPALRWWNQPGDDEE
jgi:FkbM family methyltransferase